LDVVGVGEVEVGGRSSQRWKRTILYGRGAIDEQGMLARSAAFIALKAREPALESRRDLPGEGDEDIGDASASF